jgi:hypothetical protein
MAGHWRALVWVADRSPANVTEVCGAIGAVIGVVLASSAGIEKLASPEPWGLGAAIGAGVGLAVWAFCRSARQQPAHLPTAGADLLERFRTERRVEVRSQWQALLNGYERLDAEFTGYRQIAPPRKFTGSLRQRRDLAGAVDSSAAPRGGPRLLIVGLPGHGKTVAVLDVAQHLDDDHDARFGVPVVFDLGGWRTQADDDLTEWDDDLTEWMVRELCATTGPLPGADERVRRWIAAGQIAPILDGLDEITDDDSRRCCVHAINAFIHRAPDHMALVVASRPDEYTTITRRGADRLAVNAAITLGKLRPADVAARLRDVAADKQLADLAEANPTHHVAELLQIPLWLWIATTLDGNRANELAAASDGVEAQQILTDGYIDHAIADLARRVAHDATTCRRVLAAIAGFLADPRSPDSTTFRTEGLTPRHPTPAAAWVTSWLSRGLAGGLLGGLLGGLALGPSAGLIGGLLGAVVGGLLGELIHKLFGSEPDGRPARSRIRRPRVSQIARVTIAGLLSGLAGGLTLGLVAWLAVGLIDGAAFGLASALTGGLTLGLATGLSFGLAAGLLNGLMATDVVVSNRIDEGRSASQASMALHITFVGLTLGLAGGLISGLTFGLVLGPNIGVPTGLILGLPAGLDAGLDSGGWYLLMQRRVRRQAERQRLLPNHTVFFLESAADAGILRRTGGGVQIRHRVLADRLAEEAPTPGLADLRQRVGTDRDGSVGEPG